MNLRLVDGINVVDSHISRCSGYPLITMLCTTTDREIVNTHKSLRSNIEIKPHTFHLIMHLTLVPENSFF